jgi:hypothetical protein
MPLLGFVTDSSSWQADFLGLFLSYGGDKLKMVLTEYHCRFQGALGRLFYFLIGWRKINCV